MHKKARLLLLAAALLIFGTACGPRSDDTTPDMAQRLLKLRGYFFTQKDFFKAIRLGDGRAIKAFLQGGMDPNVKDEDGRTALTFALEFTETEKMGALLEKADLMLVDDQGNSPVYMALRFDHPDLFDRLLEQGADINSRGRNGVVSGQTLLYLAVQKRNYELVRKLLEKGADPNLADSKGSVPLFDTITRTPPGLEIMNALLENGADTNLVFSERGLSALILAASNFNMPPETKLQIMTALLEKGADPNKQDLVNGCTALMYTAVDYRTPTETRNQILKMLLDKGADKGLKDVNGETPFTWAKKSEDTELAAILK